jgi:hypothetical protein
MTGVQLGAAVSNRKKFEALTILTRPSETLSPQISDRSRADIRHITFEIGYHHRQETETSDSGCTQTPAVPELAKIVSRNVAILAGADNDNLLRFCWQLFEKSR